MPGRRRAALAVALTVAALASVPVVGARSLPTDLVAPRTEIVVDTGAPGVPAATQLHGVGWNTGASLAGIEPIDPPVVRVDASLERASTGPDQLDLTGLLARIAEVRRIGAEPLVILSYMPPWLGSPNAFGRDPTRVAPSDPDEWQRLIEQVVETVATAPAPAFRFEVWNEPDLPTFWQDLPTAFIDLAVRSHQAVAGVAARTGLPLRIGGPAAAAPEPVFIAAYAQAIRDRGLPLDFVSWHWYANHPFFGPDGNEGFVPDAVYSAVARRSPTTTPSSFGGQVDLVRRYVGEGPELMLSEWNVAAGGFDARHDNHEGAALAAGALIQLEAAGLDTATFYRAVSGPHPGDWGLVTAESAPKPVWWVLQSWAATTDEVRVPVTGDDDSLFVRATRSDDGTVTVLAAVFAPGEPGPTRNVTLRLPGCVEGELARIDAASSTFAHSTSVEVTDGQLALSLPDRSASRLTLSCGE